MTKTLPYFKWYPADALGDARYSGFSLPALGLFHLCLDYAWINGGLPADPLLIARQLRIERQKFLRYWREIECVFPLAGGDRRLNSRQEIERAAAHQKSASATASINARYERNTNVLPRARASDTESDTEGAAPSARAPDNPSISTTNGNGARSDGAEGAASRAYIEGLVKRAELAGRTPFRQEWFEKHGYELSKEAS